MRFLKLIVAIVFLSPAFFTASGVLESKAQSATQSTQEYDPTIVCVRPQDSTAYFKSKTAKCPSGYVPVDAVDLNLNPGDKVCYDSSVSGLYKPEGNCDSDDITLTVRTLVASTTPTQTTSTNKTSTPKPTSTTVPKPTPSASTTNRSSASTQVDCPSPNFVAKGPICVPANPFEGQGVAGTGSVTELIVMVIRTALLASGVVAVIMLIIGGYLYMTSRSNETQVTNARKTITNALIGLVLIILAYAIVELLTRVLTQGF